MRWLLSEESPQGPLEKIGRVRVRARLQRAGDHLPARAARLVAKRPDEVVTDRFRDRPALPVSREPSQLRALRLVAQGIFVERSEQQPLPALEEQRAVIELDGQHVRGCRRCTQRKQAIANLSLARPHVIAHATGRLVVAEHSLELALDVTRVGAPQSTDLRIDDAWCRGRIAPEHRARRLGAEFALRNTPDNGPGDAPAAIAQGEVLVRYPDAGREREGGVETAHLLQLQRREVRGTRLRDQPTGQPTGFAERRIVRAALDHHAMRRVVHIERHDVAASDLDALADDPEAPLSLGGRVGPPRQRTTARSNVDPIAIAIGERPGDMAVAAGRNDGQTRQGHAIEFRGCCGRLGLPTTRDLQSCSVPHGGYAQSKVHISRNERDTTRGVCARHRPGIAA